MTNKISPISIVLHDLSFSAYEWGCLEKKSKLTLDRTAKNYIENTTAIYMIYSMNSSVSSAPSRVKNNIIKIKKLLDKLSVEMDMLSASDNSYGSIIGSLGGGELGECEEAYEIAKLDKFSHRENNDDLHANIGNLLTFSAFEAGIQIPYYSEVANSLKNISKSSEIALTKLSADGGRPGDLYMDDFIIKILNALRSAGAKGPYTTESLAFFECLRGIVASHLCRLGAQEAAKAFGYLSAEGFKDRIKDALSRSEKK